MPQQDKTGPSGEGAMTGKGMGNCAGYSNWDSSVPRFFMRNRLGWGRGRGHRMHYYAHPFSFNAETVKPPSPQQERDILTNQAEWLQHQLESIRARIDSIDHKPSNQADI